MSQAESVFVSNMLKQMLCFAVESGAGALALAFEREDDALVTYVGRYDVMFVIWSDAKSESGFGIMPIKGWDVFRETVEGKRTSDLRFMAMPAMNLQHATKLLTRFGDLKWLKDFESNQPRPALN